MNQRILMFVFLASISTLASALATELAGLPLCKDRQNVVAHVLPGEWVVERALFDRLWGDSEHDLATIRLRFVEDDSKTTAFAYAKNIFQCAFQVGLMEVEFEKESKIERIQTPFALVSQHGNPTLLMDERGKGGPDRVEDPHRLFMMAIRGKMSAADMLFLGGDNNNQPFTPLTRKAD